MSKIPILVSLMICVSGCSPTPDSGGEDSSESSKLSQLDDTNIATISGNEGHNMLAKQSGLDRAMALANVVKTLESKKYCSPERTLFRGVGDGKSFWSIQCHDGESFQVVVYPDGSGGTLNCATMELVKAGDCWTPFDKK